MIEMVTFCFQEHQNVCQDSKIDMQQTKKKGFSEKKENLFFSTSVFSPSHSN